MIGVGEDCPDGSGEPLLAGVTVFVPLYNEEALLAASAGTVLDLLAALHLPHEVILGSNGSTDRTPEIGAALAARHPRVVFFHLPRRGPGRAFAEGIRRARHAFFVTLDADLSFDMAFIGKAVALLADHDAVVGAKLLGRQKRPIFRIVASEMFIFLSRLLLGLPFRDYSIGAKAYRTEWLRRFLPRVDTQTFYTQEMLYQIQRAHGKIVEIPVDCEDYRQSRFNLLHEGVYRYGRLLVRWLQTLREQGGR